MKLRNKKTGDIVELFGISRKGDRTFVQFEDEKGVFKGEYSSLAELNAEWEDYEEPKEYWYIDIDGEIISGVRENDIAKYMQSIGNYFETKEEAEKAVEKLKAWKRLKDKGFRFDSWEYEFSMVDKPAQTIVIKANAVDTNNKDLDLLFGGEE